MKKLTAYLLMLGLVFTSSLAVAELSSDIEMPVVISCDEKTNPTGGHDTFPWSSAKAFPWTSIQGTWTASVEKPQDIYLSLKVVRATNKKNQLSVEVYQASNCKKPIMRGIGVQSYNVVRINMNNYILKLGSFNTADLDMNPAQCGYRSLGASFIKLENYNAGFKEKVYSDNTPQILKSKNLILKKISTAIAPKCKNNK